MTVEAIERILQTVAENQATLTGQAARTDERLDRIAERLDQVAALRARHDEMHSRHLANMAKIERLADAQMRDEGRLDKLEASYELLEEFVRNFRNETEARQNKLENAF